MTSNDFTLIQYENILNSAINNGYNFIKFDQIRNQRSSHNCILRHDIDVELLSCLPMLEIEKKCGVKATYFLMLRSTAYNLLCMEAREIVDIIIKDGHQIGIHFMSEFYGDHSPNTIVQNILNEKSIFEQELGIKIQSTSFHQPSKAILDAQIVIPGLINTYNKNDMDDFFYISDTNMKWQGEHPTSIFNKKSHANLQLLIHPIWWTRDSCSIEDKWRNILFSNNEITIKHWMNRERSLNRHVYKLDFDLIKSD